MKFEARRALPTPEKPHGLDYSLTLHARDGEHLLGFDKAHAIREGSGPGARTRIEYDHRHKGARIRFYHYRDAVTLLADFWSEVDLILKERGAAMKTLKIGILSREKYKARTLAIARGEYAPAKDEPKVWFESVRSMSQVLSEENRALLKLILETHPQSLVELAERSGRAASNLSRTLRTMERYGLIHFEQGSNRQLAPRVDYAGVAFEMSFF